MTGTTNSSPQQAKRPDAVHRDVARVRQFFAEHAPVTVLGGAGISTASGIPDYRDRDGNWKNASPVQFGDFIRSEAIRQRYWARSFAGWSRIRDAQPNAAHRALAELERSGRVGTLITQNVDCLHGRAGSRDVIDLHGRLDQVLCLDCGERAERGRWQERLAASNPDWQAEIDYYRPDGDAVLADEVIARFNVPGCEVCGGTVKPDVVFFGENVPPARVERARAAVRDAPALAVVGSSLMVFSGFRFVRLAREIGKPVLILNRGRTRADDLATLRVEAELVNTLERVAAA